MENTITISEQERAANIAFTIKQLLINLNEQVKPQLVNAITLMEHGAQGASKEAINKALGAGPEKVLEKVKAISAAI